MSSRNKVMLMGRLGADPETRRTQDGKIIVTLRLATSETWRDRNTGEKKERTEWHQVVIFNQKLAETAEKYLRKGHLVDVEGMLCTRQWEDQSGQTRYSTEVVLKEFSGGLILMPNGQGGRPAASGPDDYGSENSRSDQSYSSASSTNELDDEIPF